MFLTLNNGVGIQISSEISNLHGRLVNLPSRLRTSLKLVHVILERAKAVNVHVPMLHAYIFVNVVEIVSELYITVVLNFCFCRWNERHAFFQFYIHQLVLLVYCSVTNDKNVSISSTNWQDNLMQLLVIKMPYFRIIALHSLGFLIKMRGRMTSYDERFWRYYNFPKNVKMSSIIHENDIITSGNLKKCLINYI